MDKTPDEYGSNNPKTLKQMKEEASKSFDHTSNTERIDVKVELFEDDIRFLQAVGKHVRDAIVSDPSGHIRMTLWDEFATKVDEGDVLTLISPLVRMHPRKGFELTTSEQGEMTCERLKDTVKKRAEAFAYVPVEPLKREDVHRSELPSASTPPPVAEAAPERVTAPETQPIFENAPKEHTDAFTAPHDEGVDVAKKLAMELFKAEREATQEQPQKPAEPETLKPEESTEPAPQVPVPEARDAAKMPAETRATEREMRTVDTTGTATDQPEHGIAYFLKLHIGGESRLVTLSDKELRGYRTTYLAYLSARTSELKKMGIPTTLAFKYVPKFELWLYKRVALDKYHKLIESLSE